MKYTIILNRTETYIVLCYHHHYHHHHHHEVCLKRQFHNLFQSEFCTHTHTHTHTHTVRSNVSSSNFQYSLFSLTSSINCLLLLPRPPSHTISPIFPAVMYFTGQFLRKMWPTQTGFVLDILLVNPWYLESSTTHSFKYSMKLKHDGNPICVIWSNFVQYSELWQPNADVSKKSTSFAIGLEHRCITWCFSDRASWIDYILITNFCALIIIYS